MQFRARHVPVRRMRYRLANQRGSRASRVDTRDALRQQERWSGLRCDMHRAPEAQPVGVAISS